jgi:hypothetical protein
MYEILEKPANKPFEFYAAYYPPIYAGFKATTIDELIEGIKKVDGFSIFYHVFHPLFSSHVVPEDMSNDFATWIRDELGDRLLAQEVSDIEGKEPRTVENVREDLIKILSGARISRTANKPFYFITCKPVVYNTERVAKSLAEFIDIIASISIRSIAYHFIFRRIIGYEDKNDFSKWIEDNYGLTELSKKLSSLDPQTYTDEEMLRGDLLKIFEQEMLSK